MADVGKVDPAVSERLGRMARSPEARAALDDLLPLLWPALESAPRPEALLVNLERLAGARPDLYARLAAEPRLIDVLAALFSGSQFLSETLLRFPQALDDLLIPIPAAEALESVQPGGDVNALRRFQRRELLRTGVADLLGQLDLVTTTRRLSDLADALIRVSLTLAAPEGVQGFAVFALGKLGGRELNYSSDVDLLFVCADGAAETHTRTAHRLIDLLAGMTDEGFLYRVDTRLRPWGRSGPLVATQSGALAYLEKHARLWERQALLKARFVAGDPSLAAEFARRSAALLFRDDPQAVRAAVRGMKDQTERYLREQGRDWGEVKLGEGSIRDVEFVVQALQLTHGARQPEVRSRNTLDALARLQRYGLLPAVDARILTDGYNFLRTVEHYLQILNSNQQSSLPRDTGGLAELARRLGFTGPDAAGDFLARYEQHRGALRAVYHKYLGAEDLPPAGSPPAPEVRRHVERMDPSYQDTFSPADIQRHAALSGALDDEAPAAVEAAPLEESASGPAAPGWRVTIVAYDYPGELTLLCGLMFASGLDIQGGDVFTYEPGSPGARRILVDVFTVVPIRGPLPPDFWAVYQTDLIDLLRMMQAGRRQDARVELSRRVALAVSGAAQPAMALYPIEIEIDNDGSPLYTVLRITSQDTPGFLYELTGALAFHNIYIARVQIDTAGRRVEDVLWVTDERGEKITAPARQRELRAATVLIKHFTHLLPRSPDPAAALLHFRQFIADLFQRPDWPDEIASLEQHAVLDALARLLGVSNFLWDDFLRMQHGNLFPVVQAPDALVTARSRAQLQAALELELAGVHPGPQPVREDPPWRAALNAFKDREMFRIDMRHILGHTEEFWEFAAELSDLAEVVVNAAFHLCGEDLRATYGAPRREDGQPAQMAVLALGKFGGQEPGFASDIELMFVYDSNGRCVGGSKPAGLSAAEFFEKLVENFCAVLRSKREGIFAVDLQLRPYGKTGSLAVSLEAFRRYFTPGGPAWPYERQALVRLRAVAGDAALGRQVEALRDAFVYTGQFDAVAMRAMRERQVRHLVRGGTFNAKYSPGGLADLEYLIQGLQIRHGAQNTAVRTANTRAALAGLAVAGVLSEEDYTTLRKAHTFLRWLIDGLRVVAGNAQDLTVPPAGSEGFAYLARRLRYEDAEQLQADLALYSSAVVEASRRLLG